MKRGLETAPAAGAGRSDLPGPAALAEAFPELEILGLIGRGGMGGVYRARQRQLERVVALKILSPDIARDPSFAERFAREARALARLSHPHIVSVHDFGRRGDLFYLLMEYIDGANLRQVLAGGRLSPKEALAIVPQVCEALQYAHDQGVVHRDIKPENVLIDRQGRVKIADFGLAKILGHAPDLTLTGTGALMGTPPYMAPEQIERPKEVDHRADIYALGVVFYQMLTGELPLGRFAPPSRKVRIDVRLDEIVLRTLEKEPEMRYQQAGELKTQVEIVATSPGIVSAGPEGGKAASMPRAPAPVAATPAAIGDALRPRLCVTALVGALWVAVGAALAVLGLTTRQSPHPEFVRILVLIVLFSTPFGTTICGAVAVSRIRHSGGRLYGLGLAVFEALLFPLLLLDAAIMAGVILGVRIVAH
jgi:predicted Ser/Thr protein kinase